MFRLNEGHFARYDLATYARNVVRVVLRYTILIVEDDGTRKKLLAVYCGEVVANGFPVEELRKGAGVTVETIRTSPRQVWPSERRHSP